MEAFHFINIRFEPVFGKPVEAGYKKKTFYPVFVSRITPRYPVFRFLFSPKMPTTPRGTTSGTSVLVVSNAQFMNKS